jgi:hypothetical protein
LSIILRIDPITFISDFFTTYNELGITRAFSSRTKRFIKDVEPSIDVSYLDEGYFYIAPPPRGGVINDAPKCYEVGVPSVAGLITIMRKKLPIAVLLESTRLSIDRG